MCCYIFFHGKRCKWFIKKKNIQENQTYNLYKGLFIKAKSWIACLAFKGRNKCISCFTFELWKSKARREFMKSSSHCPLLKYLSNALLKISTDGDSTTYVDLNNQK